jgi:formylglycine-generating enzyme required for sulfatase activity
MKKKMLKALAKHDKSNYTYIPSGSSSYKGKIFSVQAFYMQVNEVTNAQYRTFLNDLLIQNRKEEYKKAYPQEFQWSEKIEGDQSTMQKLYFTHPAYDDYPVVNITREGAEMYCMWLTLETRKSKYISNASALNDVRLPQRLEWVYAASGGKATNTYPWGGPSTQNAEKCYLANYNPDTTNMQADGAFYTAQTETYNPNDFGLYNMSGNVAEMVYGSTEITTKSDLISFKNDPGTAGGGWIDSAETLKIEGNDPYSGITEGHPNIGFRVVLTYLKVDN